MAAAAAADLLPGFSDAVGPGVAAPGVSEPGVLEPGVSEPEPELPEPGVSVPEPGVLEPEPGVLEPGVLEPGVLEPEPGVLEPELPLWPGLWARPAELPVLPDLSLFAPAPSSWAIGARPGVA